jgi:serine-type D-Ala-D-Ala carboxypeptidase/endopeptidase
MTRDLQQYADRAVAAGHVGIVIGAISAAGTEWAAAGSTGRRGRRPDDRTIFRLASLSKVFTATALAIAVTSGDIALDQPVLHHITYRHLATHTSGLPRGDIGLLEALRAVPGTGSEYSNIGVAALGALLGPDYEAVIRERIGLPDVTTVLDAEQLGRLAPGHDENGGPVVTPVFPLVAPSGGLYGTVADLLVFMRQYLAPDAARRLAVTDRLCWIVDGERVWHNGALPGYRCYLAFCPVAGTGVAVLSNSAISVDDLGVEVLTGLSPAAGPRPA